MDIKKAANYLEIIKYGHDTKSKINGSGWISSLGSIDYNLKQLQKLSLIKRRTEGNTKPYKLTEKGEKYLKLMG